MIYSNLSGFNKQLTLLMSRRSTLGSTKDSTKAVNLLWALASLIWVVFGSFVYSVITGQLPKESYWLRKVIYGTSLSSLSVKFQYGVFYSREVVSYMSANGIL